MLCNMYECIVELEDLIFSFFITCDSLITVFKSKIHQASVKGIAIPLSSTEQFIFSILLVFSNRK